tara:strand:+ start:160 stop:375 length:216 start_codon:yes stop_codon:yes gene_type:complete
MKDGFTFRVQVGPSADDVSQISIPMDRLGDFVQTVSLLDKLGDPVAWKYLNSYKVGDCTALRIDNGQVAHS